jgi:hypothetical protein
MCQNKWGSLLTKNTLIVINLENETLQYNLNQGKWLFSLIISVFFPPLYFYNKKFQLHKLSNAFVFNLSKPTGFVMHHQFNFQQLYALPTPYLCFVFVWEQTATCTSYSINWLVFITEVKSVYSAVRTGSLNKAVRASSVKGFN